MKQFKWQIILILAAVAVFFLYPYFSPVELPLDGFSTMGADTVRAEVTQILEEGQIAGPASAVRSTLAGSRSPAKVSAVGIGHGSYPSDWREGL